MITGVIRWLRRLLRGDPRGKQPKFKQQTEEAQGRQGDLDQQYDIGVSKTEAQPMAILLDGLALSFAPNSVWRARFEGLKTSRKSPVESLTVSYRGREGLWLDVDYWALYSNPSVPRPMKAWSRETHCEFSKLFKDMVIQYLLVCRRFKVPGDVALIPWRLREALKPVGVACALLGGHMRSIP